MDYKLYAKELVNEREDIIAAYGYGSGFIHQSGYNNNTKKSLDLIFVVDDIKRWNNNNFKLHANDYSKYTKAIFKMTPKKILKSGTNIIYNIISDRYETDFKYGLIEVKDFLRDLYTWKHFYICGRMQKPIYTIKSNPKLDNAIDFNRKKAILTVLIMLDKTKLTIEELLEEICKLSYKGDIRTLGLENPNKVKNIVRGSLEELKNIYCGYDFIKIIDNMVYVDFDLVYSNYLLFSSPKYCLEYPYTLPIDFEESRMCANKIYREIFYKNIKESMIHPIKQFYVSGFSTCQKYINTKVKKKTLK